MGEQTEKKDLIRSEKSGSAYHQQHASNLSDYGGNTKEEKLIRQNTKE